MRLRGLLLTFVAPAALGAQQPADSVRPVPPLNAITPLGGREPGVMVLQNGQPGGDVRLLMRGHASPAGRLGPLFIIDGLVAENGVEGLAPGDIQHVEVLRGAAAASVYGVRAGNGVVLIRTRRGRDAGRLSFGLRGEASATSLEGGFPRARSTALLTDERGDAFCVSDPANALCARTFYWQTELARVNNFPDDTIATPLRPAGDPFLGAPVVSLANLFQARAMPGTRYDQVSQVTRSQLLNVAEADVNLRAGPVLVRGSISRLRDPGRMRFRDGYERLTARLNLDRRLGRRWSVSLRGFGSSAETDGPEPYVGDRVLFEAAMQPGMSDVLALDTLGRPYVLTTLSGSPLSGSPARTLRGVINDRTSDRLSIGAGVRFAASSWAELYADFGIDHVSVDQLSDFDPAARATVTLSMRQVASSHALAATLGLVVRRQLDRHLATTTHVRVENQTQDEEGTWEICCLGGIQAVALATSEHGIMAATTAEYRGRYVVDGLIRRDGMVFSGAHESHISGRLGLTWRASQEPWWFAPRAISRLALRAARGSAGGRPNYPKVTEVSSPSVFQLGVPPSGRSVETELGADLELFGRVGVTLTRAVSSVRDEPAIAALAPSGGGAGLQFMPIEEISIRTWELAVTLPLVRGPSADWSVRLAYDRSSAAFERLGLPAFYYGGTGGFIAREGERIGSFYGRRFVTSCVDLPTSFQVNCGDTGLFQRNDDGFIVYVGGNSAGAFSWRDGITRNLWGTQLPSANAPWGVPLYWGAPIIVRDTVCVLAPNPTCPGFQSRLGSAVPDAQISVSTAIRRNRLSVFALLQGLLGREVWNAGRQWSYLNMTSAELDQQDRTLETAKPIGYYLRAGPGDGFNGYGGLYDLLAPNSRFVEDGGFVKLRELAVSYDLGNVGGLGAWTITLTGRNLFTISDYLGLDPEVPQTSPGFGGINSADYFAVPPARTIGISFEARF